MRDLGFLVYHFFRTGITRSSAPTGPMTESSFIVFFESDERPPVRGGRTRRVRRTPWGGRLEEPS